MSHLVILCRVGCELESRNATSIFSSTTFQLHDIPGSEERLELLNNNQGVKPTWLLRETGHRAVETDTRILLNNDNKKNKTSEGEGSGAPL